MVMISFASQAQDNWKLVKDEDGIRVFTQPVSGSDFKEFKGETDFDETLQHCVGFLMSVPHMTEWMHETMKVELVSKENDHDRVLYMIQNAPFPVRDRDFFVRNTLSQQPDDTVVYTMDLVPNKVVDSGYVHLKGMRGRVTLTPLSATRTHVEYRAHVDPGGAIPSWVANAFVTDTPFHTLKNARRVVQSMKTRLSFASIRNRGDAK